MMNREDWKQIVQCEKCKKYYEKKLTAINPDDDKRYCYDCLRDVKNCYFVKFENIPGIPSGEDYSEIPIFNISRKLTDLDKVRYVYSINGTNLKK